MLTDDFAFMLPPKSIAQHRASPPDSAKLLQITRSGLFDKVVSDLPDLLRPGDCLVVNNTKVIPAQLQAYRGEAKIGITLDHPLADGCWQALAKNARRLHPGDELIFTGGAELKAKVISLNEDGSVRLLFSEEGEGFFQALKKDGKPALPPYIKRPNGPSEADVIDYQTVFAKNRGAVAAPTAGLHFTPALIEALKARGIFFEEITLHVGAGTFLPVRADNPQDHKIHAEYGEISPKTAERLNQYRQSGGRLVAVGTTSLRLLESAADEAGLLHPFHQETEIFILPGYRFRAVDLLMTNFHLPRSTLFMLVSAFAGLPDMQKAYAHAIKAGYRFYSYGDACLIEPEKII